MTLKDHVHDSEHQQQQQDQHSELSGFPMQERLQLLQRLQGQHQEVIATQQQDSLCQAGAAAGAKRSLDFRDGTVLNGRMMPLRGGRVQQDPEVQGGACKEGHAQTSVGPLARCHTLQPQRQLPVQPLPRHTLQLHQHFNGIPSEHQCSHDQLQQPLQQQDQQQRQLEQQQQQQQQQQHSLHHSASQSALLNLQWLCEDSTFNVTDAWLRCDALLLCN